jgi:hypothetical protein
MQRDIRGKEGVPKVLEIGSKVARQCEYINGLGEFS